MENIDKNAICELSELLHKNNLREIEYEAENVRIRVVANYEEKAIPTVVAAPVATSEPVLPSRADDKKNTVKSPMVGIVYLSSDPKTAPFVREGDMVGVGQTLCLVEAMKTFNPVKAEKAGKIKEVLVESGMPVEFGEPLFVIE